MKLQIEITGKTPLLLHRFTDEDQLAASAGSRSSIANDSNPARDEAAKSLYLDEQGRSIMPGPNIFRSLIDAGKFHKVGRTKVTTLKSSLVAAAASIEEFVVPIESAGDWKVDTRPVRIPATGGRILRHRPCYDDWRLRFTLNLDVAVISEKLMREIMDDAGNKIGLGDFRPDCKGPFGKFAVTRWEASVG